MITRETKSDKPVSMYVASLRDMKSSISCGVWVDCALDWAKVEALIADMLETSLFVKTSAIVQHELGVRGLIDVTKDPRKFWEVGNFISQYPECACYLINHFGIDDLESCKLLAPEFAGIYDSDADYARALCLETKSIPETLFKYVDFEKMADDMDTDRNMTSIDIEGDKVAVFSIA